MKNFNLFVHYNFIVLFYKHTESTIWLYICRTKQSVQIKYNEKTFSQVSLLMHVNVYLTVKNQTSWKILWDIKKMTKMHKVIHNHGCLLHMDLAC